ncbi:hypothetical protein [Embleya sp. NPDC005971]|uniref:hypothetical protein n=1 Tax=Embleya sp. NPDC005971 TaxID=3156724 RepID=UPI00340650BC
MTWFLYVLIGYFILGAMVTMAIVGKPRLPITNGAAMFVVLANAVITVGLVMTLAELR